MFVFSFGAIRLSAAKKQDIVNIGLIQPNAPLTFTNSARSPEIFVWQSIEYLKRQSLELISRKPELIIWPELSVSGFCLQDQKINSSISDFVKIIKTPLLFGTLWWDYSAKKPSNVAAAYSSSGSAGVLYSKNCLMPFAETSNYSAGRDFPAIKLAANLPEVGVFICFESLFPRIAKTLKDNGAKLLVLLSNDAWFGKTRWPYLHADNIFFRAVETNLPAIHLSNCGPSYVVDGYGRQVDFLPAFQSSAEVFDVTLFRQAILPAFNADKGPRSD